MPTSVGSLLPMNLRSRITDYNRSPIDFVPMTQRTLLGQVEFRKLLGRSTLQYNANQMHLRCTSKVGEALETFPLSSRSIKLVGRRAPSQSRI
jgi:hypothetical protein